MGQQKLTAGGYLDLLTKDELQECMGHSFDSAIRDLYRGIDYLSFVGNVPGAQSLFTIPVTPQQGYTWSVKLISAVLGTAGNFSAYIGTSTSVPAVGVSASINDGINNLGVLPFSSNQVVIKDGQSITVSASGVNTVNSWRLLVLQVPTEMQGKL